MGAAMTEPFRLRLKIGEHEFEASGDQEAVERQFSAWRSLILDAPKPAPPPPQTPPPGDTPPPPAGIGADAVEFERIFSRDGRRLALTVLPPGEARMADAALLLLFGHRLYNGTDQVGGIPLLEGMKHSGYGIDRVDRIMSRYEPEHVIRTGARRGVKYRLTLPGLARAREIAKELVAMVP